MDLTKPVRFRGVPFECGDDVMIVPAITCDQADTLAEEIDQATSPSGIKQVQDVMNMDAAAYRSHSAALRGRRSAMQKVIMAAVGRNYPDLPVETANELVTQENVQDLFNAAMAFGAAERIKDPGEWKASREKPGPTLPTGPTPEAESPRG